MSLLRPFRTLVSPVAGDEPWSTTQLPSGASGSFDIRQPTGPIVVGMLPASFETYATANVDVIKRPQLFLPGSIRSLQRLEHVSPLPTIATVFTGPETSRRNTAGKLRIWLHASPSLENGVWCEIERTADDDTPNNFFAGITQTFIADQNFSSDDGRSEDFPIVLRGGPQGVGGVRSIYRLLRMRYGYTLDGNDVVIASYRNLNARNQNIFCELSMQPLDCVKNDDSMLIASVVIRSTDGLLNSVSDPWNVFAFECPVDAVRPLGADVLEQVNALQWVHSPATVEDELQPPQSSSQQPFTATTHPIPVAECYLHSAIADNVTRTVPRVDGIAESESLNHQIFTVSTAGTTSQGFIDTPQQGRADISQRTGFSVKSGPWWHDMAIVSPGTSAAITGARHRLSITMPAWNEGLTASVTYSTIFIPPRRTIQLQSNAALHRRALQGQSFVCDPTIEGEQLLQCSYHGARNLNLIDTQSPGPHDIPITTADFTLLPHAQWFVNTVTYTQQQVVSWPDGDPWQSLDSAADAGISADDWNYYRREWIGATIPADSFALAPAGVGVFVDVIMNYQWTITRLEPVGFNTIVTGIAVRHFADSIRFLFFLTDEQCVALANGDTLSVPQYGGLPIFGGTPTGYTATMSLSVLS